MARSWPRTPEIKVAGKTETTVARERNRRAGPGKEMQRPPFGKLSILGGCVSVLAALFLAAAPDFQPDIVLFPQRVAIFTLGYTMPTCFLQLGVLWILSFIRRR
jgi:hypothetical protein